MRPYTIDQLSSPSEEKSADIFELVGVLVHSGTAESGHYYSYIRQRPTSGNGEVWIEFNDDLVTHWDPSQMESSCFGGTDYRGSFDANGMSMEKSYSAYMLFYQRSSSLEKAEQALVESGEMCPVRVDMPEELATHIRNENSWLVRRHCLYDPGHIQFVSMALAHVRNVNGGECSADHKLETGAIEMALSHLDQVASRAKDIPDFQNLLGRVMACCQTCVNCCFAVYSYFDERHEALRNMGTAESRASGPPGDERSAHPGHPGRQASPSGSVRHPVRRRGRPRAKGRVRPGRNGIHAPDPVGVLPHEPSVLARDVRSYAGLCQHGAVGDGRLPRQGQSPEGLAGHLGRLAAHEP